jgi:hypothetical protein
MPGVSCTDLWLWRNGDVHVPGLERPSGRKILQPAGKSPISHIGAAGRPFLGNAEAMECAA